MRTHPHLFEANALILLRRLSEKYEEPLSLATIPQKEWKSLASRGFDMVWLMGVWKRSPLARKTAYLDLNLQDEYTRVLPSWEPKDVVGSPYAIYDYSLDERLGEKGDLGRLKENLNRAGLKLILDFVPNHLAIDHPWTVEFPKRFVQGPTSVLKQHPNWFFKTPKKQMLAHGRDPYFDPWMDTVQNNFFSEEMRASLLGVLRNLAKIADGVRCDMAMLALNRIFENVWGQCLNGVSRPKREFWTEMIESVKKKNPEFLFIAEAYWDLEWELQQLGFDFTYDKKLYDRLLHSGTEDIRGHLRAELGYQKKSIRFIENHDEPRAAQKFGKAKSKAAASVSATIPGLRFIHDGQIEGRSIKLPIQLGAEPLEDPDPEMNGFYEALLAFSNDKVLHDGKWTLLYPIAASHGDISYRNLLAWSWEHESGKRLVVVNYSDFPALGYLMLEKSWFKQETFRLADHVRGKGLFAGNSHEIRHTGFYLHLEPWQTHLFELL